MPKKKFIEDVIGDLPPSEKKIVLNANEFMNYDSEHDEILTKVEKLCEKIPEVTTIAEKIGVEK